MKKILLAIIVSIIFYSVIDILIWGKIFEGSPLDSYNAIYYRGWHLVLISNIVIGSILLTNTVPFRNVLFYASTLYIFGVNGTEDILYFLLDRRGIPERLEWLDNSQFILFKPVTHEHLILNVIVWFIIWIILWRKLWKIIPVRINKLEI